MIIRRSFSDFLYSDSRRAQTKRISSARIHEHQKCYQIYRGLEMSIGVDLRVVYTGRQDLRNYAKSLVPEFLESEEFMDGEYLEIKFEKFSVYFIYIQGLIKECSKEMKDIAVLINCKYIKLSRKTPIIQDVGKKELFIRDVLNAHLYILPALRYPEKKEDIRELIKWLRLKHILLFRFKVEGVDNRVRFQPAHNTFFIPWWTRAKILTRQDEEIPGDLLPILEKPETGCEVGNQYVSVIDFRDYKIYSRYPSFYPERTIKFLPLKPLTQDIIDEWIGRENNGVKIIR